MHAYLCGWPAPYAEIARGFEGPGWPAYTDAVDPARSSVSWWNKYAWPFEADAYQWLPRGIAYTLLILLAIPLLVATACELWIRRRGGRLRLKIVDLLVATTLLAGLLGWGASHRSRQFHETAVIEQLREADALFENRFPLAGPFHHTTYSYLARSPWQRELSIFYHGGVRYEHQAPFWLVRLCGSQRALSFYIHPTGIIVDPTRLSDDDWMLIEQLGTLEQLRFVDRLADGDVEKLSRLTGVRSLALDEKRVGALAYPRQPTVGRELDLARISQLDHVEAVELAITGVKDEHLEKLLTLPNLQRIDMQGLYVDDAERAKLEAFRDGHPELKIQMRW
ncbi:hypothetical protein [Lacipirellula parvula]|uniref:hypothetical protein n=1 Tax=Lacipirellula parvula TaxID=2650471 RepID=UPI0012607AF7|nr:hypothetical protein [Lacipirellula parvula]